MAVAPPPAQLKSSHDGSASASASASGQDGMMVAGSFSSVLLATSAVVLTRRVLTLSEYARERRDDMELPAADRLAKHSSETAPIPVPLEPKETELLYDDGFAAWLTSRSLSLEQIRSDAARERAVRFAYANFRAYEYNLRRKPRRLWGDSPPINGREKTQTPKLKPIHKKAKTQEKTRKVRSRHQRGKKTDSEEEESDEEWKEDESNSDSEEEEDEEEDEEVEVEEEIIKSRSAKRSKQTSKAPTSRERSEGGAEKQKQKPPQEHRLPVASAPPPQNGETQRDQFTHEEWRTIESMPRAALFLKKYVSRAQYEQMARNNVFETLAAMSVNQIERKFGSPVAPIYVPLAPNETALEYEERFEIWLQSTTQLTMQEMQHTSNGLQERAYHVAFALFNSSNYVSSGVVPPSGDDHELRSEVDEAKEDRKQEGDQSERKDNEARQQDREKTQSIASRLPSNSADSEPKSQSKNAQHTLSTQLATAVDGNKQHDATKNQHVQMQVVKDSVAVATPLPSPLPSPHSKCTGEVSVSGYMACACKPCLIQELRHLAKKLIVMETELATHETRKESATTHGHGQANVPLPRLSPAELQQQISSRMIARTIAAKPMDDAIYRELVAQYEAINDQIVMNENVLESSAARLTTTASMAIAEATRLQDENEEMRVLIQGEMDERNTALDCDKTATNVVHIQRSCHHKCARLATVLAEKRESVATMKKQLSGVMADATESATKRLAVLTTLGEQLTTTEREIEELRAQRRHEFCVLIHFDERVRLLIEALLVRTTVV